MLRRPRWRPREIAICYFIVTRRDGALAQLGERLLCKHQVIGSIPIGSTTHLLLR